MDSLNSCAQAECDIRSIFKWSLTGLNSEFSFSLISCYTKVRGQSALLFTHSLRENSWMNTFPKDISTIWNTNSFIQDLNVGHCVHFPQLQSLYHKQLHLELYKVKVFRFLSVLIKELEMYILNTFEGSGIVYVPKMICKESHISSLLLDKSIIIALTDLIRS